MIALLQRVSSASVTVNGILKGRCGQGLLILLCIKKGDSGRDVCVLAEKISKLRIFADDNGKMNLSVRDIDGSALVISQFTLCANYRHGNRPDFLDAAPPELSEALYREFTEKLGALIGTDQVRTGEFGAHMQVSLVNDGPVTVMLESSVLLK